jgi:hypothetical protein
MTTHSYKFKDGKIGKFSHRLKHIHAVNQSLVVIPSGNFFAVTDLLWHRLGKTD